VIQAYEAQYGKGLELRNSLDPGSSLALPASQWQTFGCIYEKYFQLFLDQSTPNNYAVRAPLALAMAKPSGSAKAVTMIPVIANEIHLIELALAGEAQVIVAHNLRDLRGGEVHLRSLRVLRPPLCLDEWK